MLRVGLTGGIGSGKSTAARRLVALGAVLIDADQIARDVVEPGTPGHAAVVGEFGEGILAGDGSIDRPALGRVVFGDEKRRLALNAIVHPLVGDRRAEMLGGVPSNAVVIEDIPLLVENQMGPGFHLVVVVGAPAEERVRRLLAHRSMASDDAWARVNAQASDQERRAAADVWLDNSGDVGGLEAAVDALWLDRLVPFAVNVETRTPVRHAGHAVLVPPDMSWPSQAARLIARLRNVAGERCQRVDHIGSTSVPDIWAKDVIDLQVSVASLDDADAMRDVLSDAGFPVVPGVDRDNPKPADPDPSRWRKRLHASADPGRAAHVHIRELGSPGWRYALLFRDWLRAERAEAANYEKEKMRLAAHASTRDEYAEAKEPWFDAALERADAWARTSGWAPDRSSP